MPKDHSAVGVTHARVCEGEDLDPSARGGRRTRGAAVRKIQGVGNSTFVLSVENDNDFRSRCE